VEKIPHRIPDGEVLSISLSSLVIREKSASIQTTPFARRLLQIDVFTGKSMWSTGTAVRSVVCLSLVLSFP
jgi:hypothetical protein